MFTLISRNLAKTGWLLRSGNAVGADQAFQRGTARKEVHLPWRGYNNAPVGPEYGVIRANEGLRAIAKKYHPAWDRLSEHAKLLMCRNVTIILGEFLDNPVKMVVCWTPDGQYVGGTSHGMRIADACGIPVFNMAIADDQTKFAKFVLER
jgi:hypothetical protein